MRILCLAVALVGLAASASLADPPESAPGLVWSPRGAVLTRIDAVSRLALPNQRTVLLAYAHYGLSTSPDGALLATTSGMDRNVHLSDLTGLTRTWTIGPFASRNASTHWIGRRMLVVGTGTAFVVFDVSTGMLRQDIPVNGQIVAEAATTGRYVALVAPVDRLGALRLVSVRTDGVVRTVAVPAIRGGRAFTAGRVFTMLS